MKTDFFSLTDRSVSFRIQIPHAKIPPTSLRMRSNSHLNPKEEPFVVQQIRRVLWLAEFKFPAIA